jgi:enoyl-CoA hydratase/carnithine racemase
VTDHVGTIVFDRPAERNAMTWDMYQQLFEHCERIDSERQVRAVVLRGAGGKAFVAGTDIAQFTQFTDPSHGLEYEARIDEVIARLERVRVPTVAVIDGYAVGGGLMLAAACDLRVASKSSRLGLPIARTVGNCLSMRNYSRLVHLIGAARTGELVYTAAIMDAEAARECGLLTTVVAGEDMESHVNELCSRLVAHAPLTMSVTKEALRRIRTSGVPDGNDLVQACYGSRDFAEGVSAFLEKRRPQWTGS